MRPSLHSQFFARIRVVALDEITGAAALFSLELDFEQFQGGVMGAASQEAIGAELQFRGRNGFWGRLRFPDLKIFAAKFCVGAGPGLESAEAIVDF